MDCAGGSATGFRRTFLVAVAAAALFLTVAAPASAGTLDQQQTTADASPGLFGSGPPQSRAQTFTAGITGKLDQVDLFLNKIGTTPPVTVEIRTTTSSAPDSAPTSTVLATATVPDSAIGTTNSFVQVTFAAPPSVVAGTLYAIVAYSPGDLGMVTGWLERNGGNPYASGTAFGSSDPLPPGGNWNQEAANDQAFKTYVVPTPTPPQTTTGQRAAALKKCKKKHSKKAKRKCRKRAKKLPV